MSSRSDWKLRDGKWTCTLGPRGCRVRLFQKRRDGNFYRSVFREGREHVACLFTPDRGEAGRLGAQLLAMLLAGQAPQGEVRLGALVTKYLSEAPQHLDNKPATQKDTAARARTLLAFFGSKCDVRRLEVKDQAAYTRARLAGTIGLGTGTRPAAIRTVQADLNVLHAMLRWATTVRTKDGGRWLATNPLAGVPRPSERNPKRPVATDERFQATLTVMRARQAMAPTPADRARWVKMALALILAEGTGRRLGSISHLRWEDINFERQTIRWRAEWDKKGREGVIPYPDRLFEALRGAQKDLGAIGGWIFSGEKVPDHPMDRHLFDKWLRVAEEEAGLEKLKGGLWHPYRRAWATARKDLPIKDVAAAGGGSDTQTLLNCYQQPDMETLLRVTKEERKVREAGVGA